MSTPPQNVPLYHLAAAVAERVGPGDQCAVMRRLAQTLDASAGGTAAAADEALTTLRDLIADRQSGAASALLRDAECDTSD